MIGSTYLTRYKILIFFAIIFNFLVLLNILSSDYFGDDLHNFQVPGAVPFIFPTVFDLTKHFFMEWLSVNGRFFPGAWYGYYVFYMFDTLLLYKLYLVLLTIASILIFAYLVFLLSKDKYLALMFIVLAPIIIQYRNYHDPYLSFHGLMQILLIHLTISLIFFELYLENHSKYYYVLSILFYAASLLTYEISYLFILFYIPLIFVVENLNRRLKLLFPYFILLILVVLVTLYLRVNATSADGAYLPNWDFWLIVKTYINQTLSALPLTYAHATGGILEAIKSITTLETIVVTVFIILFLSLQFNAKPKSNKQSNDGKLIALGLLLMLIPGVLISLSPRYQSQISFGVAYLPVYLQVFGVTLIFASIVHRLMSRTMQVSAMGLFIFIVLVHHNTNNKVIEQVNQPYKTNRELLTTFFKSEFGQKLVDGTTIKLLPGSPLNSVAFLNMMTGKNLNVVYAQSDSCDYQINYEVTNNLALIKIIDCKTGETSAINYQNNGKWEKVQ